ncbi:MAG: zinc ABC transporter substrate-binding protein [Candidatus Hydrogenedentes bacterium]|nr:zinc ABC transporter substrate-binding protein [Candidatus Hydrogenedentota bacterium]
MIYIMNGHTATWRGCARAAGVLLLLALFQGCSREPGGAPTIVATIPPLKMILQEIVGEGATVACILPPGASPHTFELRPSVARALAEAPAVFHVDETIDGWVARLAPGRVHSVFALLPEEDRLPYETAHCVEDEVHDHEAEPGAWNAHFWLDPVAVQSVLPGIVEILSRLNPENAETYRANADRFSETLDALNREFDAARPKGAEYTLAAFHPSWTYFFHRYGIVVSAHIEPFPGREPTPQTLETIRNVLARSDHRIILSEVQLPGKPAEVLAEMLGTRVTVVDPLGGSPGQDTYAAFMRTNANLLWEAFQ